jgi:hypothetical protein
MVLRIVADGRGRERRERDGYAWRSREAAGLYIEQSYSGGDSVNQLALATSSQAGRTWPEVSRNIMQLHGGCTFTGVITTFQICSNWNSEIASF